MKDDNDKFSYTYSAPTADERREIESIRRVYEDRGSDYEKLVRLDKKARSIPMCASVSIGVVGALVFGLGMAMVTVWELMGGAAVSAAGALVAAAAYPVHKVLTRRMKAKYGPEIVRLSSRLLGEDGEEKTR